MSFKPLSALLTLIALLPSCTYVGTVPRGPIEPPSASARLQTAATLPERTDKPLEEALAKLASVVPGRLGVGAVLLETGDSAWLGRNERFVSQSVYKLPIAMAVMKMVADGRLRIDQDVNILPSDFVRRGFHSPIRNANQQGTVMPLGEVVRYSIEESDGTASDVLLNLAGGPASVQAYLSSIGVRDFIVADSEKAISRDWATQYRNYATPQATIDLLKAIQENRAGLSDWTTSFLLLTMTSSETGARRIKRGIPEGATLAHKTGTGGRPTEIPGYRNDPQNVANGKGLDTKSQTKKSTGDAFQEIDPKLITSATNDVGIITLPDGRHILLAVYLMDSPADGWIREALIAEIAKAVCVRWTTGALLGEDAFERLGNANSNRERRAS